MQHVVAHARSSVNNLNVMEPIAQSQDETQLALKCLHLQIALHQTALLQIALDLFAPNHHA